MKQFAEGFLFGSATSAHQVEGGNHNDWTEWELTSAGRLAREASRWSNYGQGPTPVWDEVKAEAQDAGNYISGRAAEHYGRYGDDLRLARGLGLNAYRFSVEWSRVEPEPGRYDEAALEHYTQMARACWAQGQEPFVTLWHFALPVWAAARGGFESPAVAEHFAAYAAKVGAALRPHVRHWATLNEPGVYSGQAYLVGVWPPQRTSVARFVRVRRGLVRVHVAAYGALKAVDAGFEVGFCADQVWYEPTPTWLAPAARLALRTTNEYFARRLAAHSDWLGLQYYIRHSIGRRREWPRSDMGWKLYPQGHRLLLRRLARYGKPLYVTESGLADRRDRYRAWYIEESLASIAEAIREGVDCRGYFHWSLLDNFEWHEGFWPRLGLIEVDRATMERRVRPSARRYAELIREARGGEGSGAGR